MVVQYCVRKLIIKLIVGQELIDSVFNEGFSKNLVDAWSFPRIGDQKLVYKFLKIIAISERNGAEGSFLYL